MPTQLPQELTKYPFAYSPKSTKAHILASTAAKTLGFTKVLAFNSESEMRNHFKRANFYNKTDEMLTRFQEKLQYYNITLNYTELNESLFTDYKYNYLEYEDIDAEQVMLGVHFNVSDSALDYTCYYNQQLLENYHSLNLDRVKSRMYPYMNFSYSPYGFSVQVAIESQFLNKKYDYNLGRMGKQDKIGL